MKQTLFNTLSPQKREGLGGSPLDKRLITPSESSLAQNSTTNFSKEPLNPTFPKGVSKEDIKQKFLECVSK